jgi:tRNA A-37 threonylcarbamoyl transferase component Bud32
MIKLQFEKDYRNYFAALGLESFDDFFSYSEGELIGKNKKRDVAAFAMGSGSDKKEFFIKRFMRPHFKDMLFTFRNSGHPCSQGQYEWESAKYLLDNGIKTYRPVCFGTDTRFGLESRSFFITEKLTGPCLSDVIAENWNSMSPEQKKRVLANVGSFVRRLHDVGIDMPDLYVWHLYLEGDDPATCDFALIDLHRMRTRAISSRQVVRNLAAMDFSMSDKYFDDEMRRYFIESYLQAPTEVQVESLYEKMRRRSKVLRTRRHPPNY